MLRRFPVALVLVAFLALSCDRAPTAVEDSATDVPTLAKIHNQWYEDTWSFDHCVEVVDADLRYKWLETDSGSASGNYNYQWKFTVHGKGVGRDTGWEYVWNNSFDWVPHEHGSPGGYQYTESFTDNWVIVGKGEAPNWKGKITSKITVNANGEVTADFFKWTDGCK